MNDTYNVMHPMIPDYKFFLFNFGPTVQVSVSNCIDPEM